MNIIITHSSGFNFKKDLYAPIRSSELNKLHNFYLPQEMGMEKITKELIKNADLIFAEVSYPSTGQGIELGWADMMGKNIIYFYKSGTKPSGALSNLTKNMIEYKDQEDLISKLGEEIKNGTN